VCDIEVDYRYDTQGRVNEIGVTGVSGRQVLLKNATYYPFGAEINQSLSLTAQRNAPQPTLDPSPDGPGLGPKIV
jgi:hypothetical protein